MAQKQWIIFPDSLPNARFSGYETRSDETQRRGTFVVGQNMKFDTDDLPTVRNGYEPIGTELADSTPVKRAWVYENKNGDVFELKAYGTKLYYWLVGVSTSYLLLKDSFTADQDFGFANIGESANIYSYCFFCNGTENPFRWTGVRTSITGTTGNTIVTAETSLANLGFTSTGSVMVNNTSYAYTGLAAGTFTGVTGDPSGEAVGSLVVQSPVELTGVVGGGTDPEKFKISMSHDGRLHYAKATKQDVWAYSKLDNPDDVATGSNDGDGGAKSIESGNAITAFGKLNKTALCFKNKIIKSLEFNQVGTRLDSPIYRTLVSTDDKGTTLGAVNQKSTFSTPLGMVFITPDKRLVLLTGVTQNNEPEYLFLSDPVQTVFDNGVFDSASGICFNNKIYISFKENKDSVANDTVLIGDLNRQTIDANGRVIPIRWWTPVVGWSVNDWTIIYNSTDKRYELHWHSSLNSNTYRIIDDKTDNTTSFTTTLRSHGETFGSPYATKKSDMAMIEIKMLENSELIATILYDDDGVSGQQEFSLLGTDTDNLFNNQVYNPFGASSFGSQKIGSNDEVNPLKKYRFFLHLDADTEFYSIALQLTGTGENSDYKLVRFGYRLSEILPEPPQQYLKSIT